jgi:hypothetical protein
MKKGDRFMTDKGIVLVFEKYDKIGDALFTSPDMDFNDIEYDDEELRGFFVLPVHVLDKIAEKIED